MRLIATVMFLLMALPALMVSSPAKAATPAEPTLTSVACAGEHSCMTVGWAFYPDASDVRTLGEAWNGSKWKIVSTISPKGFLHSYLTGVSCLKTGTCIAVGYMEGPSRNLILIERWNGKAWSVLPTSTPKTWTDTTLNGISCWSPTGCETVGFYSGGSAMDVPIVGRWNGKTWTFGTGPMPGSAKWAYMTAVSCVSATNCQAVGDWEDTLDNTRGLTERWGGKAWSVVNNPSPSGFSGTTFDSVTCFGSASCVATGELQNDKGDFSLTEHWNGKVWSKAPSPNPKGSESTVMHASACTGATACMGVGLYQTTMAVEVLSEKWNGSKWAQTSSDTPSNNASVTGLACPAANWCVMVGQDLSTSTTVQTMIQHWNGKGWAVVASPNP